MAWEREADSLDVSVSKVRDRPSVTGVKLLRTRKEELEKKVLTAHSIYEDVLSSSFDDMRLAHSRQMGVRNREVIDKRLKVIEEAISQWEDKVLGKDLEERGFTSGGMVLEKLSLPKFSGNPLDYADFKDLFSELVASLRVSKVAVMEYLKKALDSRLQYIIRCAKDRKEA